jgi:predicted Zn-dependent protease
MANERFIELLEEDIVQARKAAEHWEELARMDARLENIDGKLLATASEMVAHFRAREKELQQFISQAKKV